jgi:transposase
MAQRDEKAPGPRRGPFPAGCELELPEEERETIAGGLGHVDFFTGEITELEAVIAREALASADVRRLVTVPGVSVITASTFIAAIGDIHRFRSARQLVGYLDLDPRVRQSGTAPARHGKTTKQGSAPVRHVLARWRAVGGNHGPQRAGRGAQTSRPRA